MCRNIRTLFNFDPPATDEEVAAACRRLLDDLVTGADPKNRELEAARARARAQKRFGAA